MSRKAKKQWRDPQSGAKIREGLRKAGVRRRRSFEDLTEAAFCRLKHDGRIYAWYWDGDRKRTIYRYQWRWIVANGPIPPGMVLHHKNGDPADDRLENLQLMTNSEHKTLHPLSNSRREYLCQNCGSAFMKTPRKDRPHKYCSAQCYHSALHSMTSP